MILQFIHQQSLNYFLFMPDNLIVDGTFFKFIKDVTISNAAGSKKIGNLQILLNYS